MPKNKILIIEDDPGLALTISDRLEAEGYSPTVVHKGEEAIATVFKERFDLILLDIMLRRSNGFDLCKRMRDGGISTPIIFLTALGQIEDKVRGLRLGGDDYLTKPFDFSELVARVEVQLRRDKSEINSELFKLSSEIIIDFNSTEVRKNGEIIPLSFKEYELLKYLIFNKGKTVSRDEILNDVWGYDDAPTTRTIDTHIGWLRSKIENNPKEPKLLLTVHGVGYKLVSEVC